MNGLPQTKYFEQQIDEKPIDEQINEWKQSYMNLSKSSSKHGLKPVILTQPVVHITSIQTEKSVFAVVRNCTIEYLEMTELQLNMMATRGQMPGQA